jgi:hypothetical protein
MTSNGNQNEQVAQDENLMSQEIIQELDELVYSQLIKADPEEL